jgi:photosystem II stability/assembly factor-like uncharacterized protein
MKKTISLSFLLLCFMLTAKSQTWDLINPFYTDAPLTDICFKPQSYGYISAGYGVMLKTNDNGNSWHKLITNTTKSFTQISFYDKYIGYAIAEGSLFKTINGGISWDNISTSNNLLSGFGISFNSVKCFDPTNIIVIGVKNNKIFRVKSINNGSAWDSAYVGPTNFGWSFPMFFYDQNIGFIGGSNHTSMYKTVNGGDTWSFVQEWANFEIKDMFFKNQDTAYFCGHNGFSGNGAIGDIIFKTTNGGNSWVQHYAYTSSNIYPKTFLFINNIGFAFGQHGYYYKTLDGGATWSAPTSTGLSKNINKAVYESGNIFVVCDGGLIAKSPDLGITWSVISSVDKHKTFNAVNYATNSNWWSVGNGGAFKSTDDGLSWQEIFIPGSNNSFSDVSFLTDEIGYISSSFNICKTIDGGNNWSLYNFNNGTTSPITDIFFSTSEIGYAGGGFCDDYSPGTMKILKTIDGGQTWTPLQTYGLAGAINDIDFISADTGYIVGTKSNSYWRDGILFRTHDGGATWDTLMRPGSINYVDFPTKNTGYLNLNGNVVMKTTNGGNSWQNIPVTSCNIGNFDFTDTITGHFINDYIKIIYTENGCYDWLPEYTDIFSELNEISFKDKNLGIAVGGNGVIIRYVNSISTVENINVTEDILSVFPNPASNFTNLRLIANEKTNVKVDIFDITGKHLFSYNENGVLGEANFNIDISTFEPGMYFCVVKTNNFEKTVKLIKQ